MSKGTVPPVPDSLSEVQAFWCSCPSGSLTPWMLGGRALFVNVASDVLCAGVQRGANSCCFTVFALPVMFDMKSRVRQPSGLPPATHVNVECLKRAALLFCEQTPCPLGLIYLSLFNYPLHFSPSIFRRTCWVFWALLF